MKSFYTSILIYSSITLVLLCVGAAFFASESGMQMTKRYTASIFESVHTSEVISVQKTHMKVSPDELIAQAAIVYDPQHDAVLFEKNSELQLPLASLTKLMTALVASEHVKDDAIVTITSEALKSEGEYGLQVGERWRLKDLTGFMLVSSSNDAASAIAEYLDHQVQAETSENGKGYAIALMNQESKRLGLTETNFDNETGLDESIQSAGAYGSAADVARLGAYIASHYPALLDNTDDAGVTFFSLDGVRHTAKNTNLALADIPGVIGGKTGFTDLAGGNLMVIFERDIGNPLVIVVLGSTKEGRFEDMVTLVQRAINQE